MAVDSKQKRFSAIGVTLPFRGAPIDPTVASFGAGDRAAAAYFYGGIESGIPPTDPSTDSGVSVLRPVVRPMLRPFLRAMAQRGRRHGSG